MHFKSPFYLIHEKLCSLTCNFDPCLIFMFLARKKKNEFSTLFLDNIGGSIKFHHVNRLL